MSKKFSVSAKQSKVSDKAVALSGGEVFAIPLGEYGFASGVVSRPQQAETGLLHVYLRLENPLQPFAAADIGTADQWPAAWIGLVTTKSLMSKRWPVVGKIDDFDLDAFPIPPTRHDENKTFAPESVKDLFSIETTLDEPSMTPISNVAATEKQAAIFPPLNIIIAGSNLEKSLIRYVRKMGFTFHDVPIEGHVVGPEDIANWNSHAKKIRTAFDPSSVSWLAAGSKTDRDAKPGDWFGFPMPGGGFGAAMLLERPPKHLRVMADAIVISMRRRWDHWPAIKDVMTLTADDAAIIRQMSMITVRDGRWRAIGRQPGFDASQWPWPRVWSLDQTDAKGNLISVRIGPQTKRDVRIDRKVLDLDPLAGWTVMSMSSGDTIAMETYRLVEGITSPRLAAGRPDDSIVTPQRIAAWRKINAAIAKALVEDAADCK